jgi:uncharacterized membrane protein affecting hemolysin expression
MEHAYSEKTSNLLQIIEKLLSQNVVSGFERTTLVVIID